MLPHSRGPALRVLVLLAALLASFFAFVAPASAATDTDKDGLPDSWEKKGGKAPGGLDIYKLGARYNHKDVFLELNYTPETSKTSQKVTCAGLDALYNAFAKAPVTNPDNKSGIKIHIDAGKTCTSRKYNMGGSGVLSAGASTCVYPNGRGIATNRARVFHNGIVAGDGQVCGPEGFAFDPDFVVKRADGGVPWAHTAMHELGHIFGLDHGFVNTFSVMSGNIYKFTPNGTPAQILDFTRYPVDGLTEAAVSEENGYTSPAPGGNAYLAGLMGPRFCPGYPAVLGTTRAFGPTNFDCSGGTLPDPNNPKDEITHTGTVKADLNGDGDTNDVIPPAPAQWPTVVAHLGAGRIG